MFAQVPKMRKMHKSIEKKKQTNKQKPNVPVEEDRCRIWGILPSGTLLCPAPRAPYPIGLCEGLRGTLSRAPAWVAQVTRFGIED